MATNLPVIFSAGHFHSKDKFSEQMKYPDGSVTKLRTLKTYELELYSNSDGITYLNQVGYERKRGSLLISQPGDRRQSTLHFDAIFLHFECTDPGLQELIQSISGFHSDSDYNSLAPELLDICDIALSFAPNDDILASAKLIQFLCNIKKNYLPVIGEINDSANLSIVSNAIEYMKQFYMIPLTVDKIAESCGLSTSYFHRVFWGTVHTTPNNYLLEIRMSHAKSLLASSSMPISEVAIKCGFNSQAYFSDCFKRKFGITPRLFRKSFLYPDVAETIFDSSYNHHRHK